MIGYPSGQDETIKKTGYRPRSFSFGVFMELDEYPVILTSHLVWPSCAVCVLFGFVMFLGVLEELW